MLNYFEFDGKRSLDFGLLIRNKKTYNQAKRDLSFLSVPGRSGDIVLDNGRYENITIGYGVTMFAPVLDSLAANQNFNLAYATQNLKDWLISDGKYYKLIDCYDPNYYRIACYDSGMDFDALTTNVAKTEISFNCKPYKYRIDGDTTIKFEENGGFIYNPEKHEALPIIRIYGTGDFGASVYHEKIFYNFGCYGVSEYIDIDSETQNAYKGHKLQNNRFRGSFPVLAPGLNQIRPTSSGITGFEIIPRWRTI